MSSFDVTAKWQVLEETTEAAKDLAVSGRVLLHAAFPVQLGGRGDRRSITFHNGTSGSDPQLFEFTQVAALWGPQIVGPVFPDNGILFDSGLFVASGNDASNQYWGMITVLYSLG
jgi:hypothetical protein